MEKHNVSWSQYQSLINKICRDIVISGWRPDYVVGITRGGLPAAVMISHYFNIPCETLKISLRDGSQCESNLWMAQDAFGNPDNEINFYEGDPTTLLAEDTAKQILIVDDINDSGSTFNWLMNDWASGCYLDHDVWKDGVWNINVKFAVLFDNMASKCNIKMDFVGEEINKAERDIWIDFPYEDWWTK